ncbi:hypothetical protein [Marinicella sp. W31]|uniref:hypothetical protein n=1 Tax=Marinicella sp. W31 TaxID=3023713 RepID=UPI003758167D
MKKILFICCLVMSVGAAVAKPKDHVTALDVFLAKQPTQASFLDKKANNKSACETGCYLSYLNCVSGGIPQPACLSIFSRCLDFCNRR